MQLKGVCAIKRGPVPVTGPSVPLTGPSVPLTSPRFPLRGPFLIVELSVTARVLIAYVCGGASKNIGLGRT